MLVALVAGGCVPNRAPSPTASAPAASPGSPATPSAVATPGATTTARFEPVACRFDDPRVREVDCGDLVVPEDRSDTAGGDIRLHVGIFRSPRDSPEPDPVVFLGGGPGSATLQWVPELLGSLPVLERDVVIVDQRGTGFSEPRLDCPEVVDLQLDLLSEAVDLDLQRPRVLAAADACRDRLMAEGADLDAYSSAENAADIADLRTALGYDSWNVYGISYGTRLTLTLLRDHPAGIRSVILDSVVPPSVSVYEDHAANALSAFETLFDACADSRICADAHPDLETRFWALVDRLDRSPVRFTIDLEGRPTVVVGDGVRLVQAVFGALYDTWSIPLLPAAIDALEAGDTRLLEGDVHAAVDASRLMADGMHYSVQCTDEASQMDTTAIEAAIAGFRPEFREWAAARSLLPIEVCSRWPADTTSGEDVPVGSEVPTLILSGAFDPITPPSWGEVAAEMLPAAHRFVFPATGHGVLIGDACAVTLARSFLAQPAGEPDAGCVAQLRGPLFLP